MFKNLLFFCFLFGFAFISFCYADVPNEIRYNGKLKEYRVPVSGTKQMNFKFYSEEKGGTALWESGTQSVEVSSGIFTYVIKPRDLNDNFVDWRNKDIYLEIEISGNRLEPREKILAVPYSLHSNTTENAMLVEGSQFSVTIGNNKNFVVNSTEGAKAFIENTEYYMVPKGAIIIWSGAADKIPAGWVLCDGTNGTPDLRDRFVVGAGNKYSVNATGGEEEHTLTIEEMPSHSHKYTSPLKGKDNNGLANGNHYNGETFMHPAIDGEDTGSTGGSQAHNNMPPYYSLCYIMKK